MPPFRTPQTTIPKPIKTERSHEENQERAYIAASRRSDRSLEARIESARRASEIHKRRTGRSLRVSPEDVQNEEMYEEEDDDLPMQYRRLTAHLNPSSSAFNQKLAAHVQYNVAAQTAFGMAMSNRMPQSGMGLFNDSMMQNGQQNQQQMQNPWMQNMANLNFGSSTGWQMPPNTMKPQHASSYRFTPYPINTNQSFQTPQRPQTGESPSSMAPPHSASIVQRKSSGSDAGPQVSHERRMSEPVQTQKLKQEPSPTNTPSKKSQHPQRTSSTSQLPLLSQQDNQQAEGEDEKVKEEEDTIQDAGFPSSKSDSNPMFSPMGQSDDPFTTMLAPDVQSFLPPAFTPNFANGEGYSYNPNSGSKHRNTSTGFEGMNQTLAPSAGFGQADQSQQTDRSPKNGWSDLPTTSPLDFFSSFPGPFDAGANSGTSGTPTGIQDSFFADPTNGSGLDLSSWINFSETAEIPDVAS
ncbi:MAG: hypothetical protein M1831_004679 [Alyxoria varia]|nr:MAG: hypothetical protein M1831_004679 [Alyxoria varia]